ncbi:MAG: FixH family protein [Gallionella sp.]
MQVAPTELSKKWLVVLIGLVIFGVSASMILISITMKHKPNLVDKNYYENGRAYESTVLQQVTERQALGWDMQLQIPSTIVGETVTYLLGSSGTYQFSVHDKDSHTLSGAQATLFAYRPSDSQSDMKVKMVEVSSGIYQAYLNLPLQGAWMLTAQARVGKDVSEVARNIYVLPAQ